MASTEGAERTAAPKTRLLKDAEAEERRVLYNELYRSLHEQDDAALRRETEEQSANDDVLQQARKLKEEFTHSVTMPLGQKSKQCGQLLQLLADPRSTQTVRIFVWCTCIMFTLPIIALLIGMHIVAPYFHMDPVLTGGFVSVATVLAIAASYTIYALLEEKRSGEQQQKAEEKDKKRQ